MIELKRGDFESEPQITQIVTLIATKHIVAPHTRRTLLENQGTLDFCEMSRHYATLKSKSGKNLFIHYDVTSQYKKPRVLIVIDAIGIYQDFLEYNLARLKGLNSQVLNHTSSAENN
jgi:hypothetical protein